MTTPVLYIPHGGGPWPWIRDFGGPGAMDPLREHLEALPASFPRPQAILCITAHWEAPVATVSSSEAPGMLYDYYGFPQHTYSIQWPAPGSPELAQRVRGLLDLAGLPSAEDGERGFDHGTFVPLAVAWPEPEIPVVQLSLVRGLDPALHLELGRALRPLRDQGVLLVGSGMSYHDLRGFGSARGRDDSLAFDAWLAQAVSDPSTREASLRRWTQAPAARAAHPREEHLLPLMVAAGAAEGDEASLPFRGDVLGTRVSSVRFG